MMQTSDIDLPYDNEKLREFVEDAVAGDQRHPRWYAITGSHLYGFDSEGSDIDVRGWHTVPGEQYAFLDDPKQEVTVNMDGTTDGFEHMADVDMRSYELRHFGEHLYGANYNAIELVTHAPVLMNGVPLEMDALVEIVQDELPMNVPHSYIGMAKSNYYNYLDPDKAEAYDPRPKKYLYVLRGLYAAQYVQDHHAIEPDVTELAESVDFANPTIVEDLIEIKRADDITEVPEDLQETYRDYISSMFNQVDEPDNVDKSSYRDRLDSWMRKVRL